MSRLLRSRRGHISEGEEDDYGSDSYSITTNSFSDSDSERDYTDGSSDEEYTDSEEETVTEEEDETEEEEDDSDAEEDQSQPVTSSQQQALVSNTTEDVEPNFQQSSHTKDPNIVKEEEIDYQSHYDDKEKRIQEHREYRRKLVEDPSFVPYVGSFWGHDDRYREDLLTETRAESSQPYFSNNHASNGHTAGGSRNHDGNRHDIDPLMYKKWDHSGYEELLRMDEEDERRKRSLIEAGKTEELANFRPYRPRYHNNHNQHYSRGPRNYKGHGSGDQRSPHRQQRTQHEEWPELSHNSQEKLNETATVNKEQRDEWSQPPKDDHGWGNALVTGIEEIKLEENGWKEESKGWKEESTGWGDTATNENNDGWSKPSPSSPDKHGWDSTDKTIVSNDNQPDQNNWSASENQAVTDDLKDHTDWSNTKFSERNSDRHSPSDKQRKVQPNIPNEEKASSSWTLNAVPEIEVPTTPSKWTTRSDRGRGRFNNNDNYQNRPRRDHRNTEDSWRPKKAEQEEQITQEWKADNLDPSPVTNSPAISSVRWDKPDTTTTTAENGWGESVATTDDNKGATATNGWEASSTVENGTGWNSDMPESNNTNNNSTTQAADPVKEPSAVWNQSKETELQPNAVEVDTKGWGPAPVLESQNKVDSDISWATHTNNNLTDNLQNISSEGTAAGWGDLDVSKLSEDANVGWKTDTNDEKFNNWDTHKESVHHPPRKGRGYLSQKMDAVAPTTATATPSNVSEEDQFSSQQQLSQEATPVMSAWGNFHNGGDEDSDVEIILEAEEEPEWLKQEQVLGMTAPGDMDASASSPYISSSPSMDDSPSKHASRQHYYSQAEYSPRFDSRKPRYNTNSSRPRRQFDESWRRRKDDSPHQGPPLPQQPQQQPVPTYYPTPQHMNGANITYVPMIPNTNYLHMGGNVQPNDSSVNGSNKFYAPLPPGFEANGMVYYGVDPNLYPPVQPFYYYMPINNNNGVMGSSVAYEEPRSPPTQRLQEEDDDEGWGPSPDIGDADTQWKSHNNRHQQNPPNHTVNYNPSPYYYYPQQSQPHF
ncbi:hypothetical protein A0J61_06101 [Choanephora cucurbitarum]|uniref:Btz domain-containing protein n=1 Tax=Choanephora cucurbitarum TaxID=101091 RepID=A0A1C7N9M8_9FUNG|nr:hypothetical protein A0J61_06101 [Choanephora cucurbitarum]